MKQEPSWRRWRWRHQASLSKGLLPQPTADVQPPSNFKFHPETFLVPGWARDAHQCAVYGYQLWVGDQRLAPPCDGVRHVPGPLHAPTQSQPRAECSSRCRMWASPQTDVTSLWLLISGKGWWVGRLSEAWDTMEQGQVARNQPWSDSRRGD